jgi:hypothetical protein
MKAILTPLLFLVIAGSIAAQSQPPAPSPSKLRQNQQRSAAQDQQHRKKDQGQSEQAPIFVKVVEAPPTKEEGEERAAEKYEESLYKWGTLTAASATVVVLVWQGIALLLQVRTSRNQIRAYMVAIPGEFIDYNPKTKTMFELIAHYQNAGQTPAFDVYTVCSNGVLEFPLPDKYDFDEILEIHEREPGGLKPSVQTIGAGQTGMIAPGPIPIQYNSNVIADIKACRGLALYIWGKITYRDIFKSRHTTRFCLYLMFDTKGNVVNWTNTHRYNDVD